MSLSNHFSDKILGYVRVRIADVDAATSHQQSIHHSVIVKKHVYKIRTVVSGGESMATLTESWLHRLVDHTSTFEKLLLRQ